MVPHSGDGGQLNFSIEVTGTLLATRCVACIWGSLVAMMNDDVFFLSKKGELHPEN